MKKRLAVLVLASAMLLSACGSSAKEAEEVVETVAEEAEEIAEEAEAEVEETVEEVIEEAEAEAEEVIEEAEEAAEEVLEEAAAYVKGTVTETGWESEWIGLRFTTPEGAVMSTEEELAATMGLGQEILAQDFTEQQLAYAEVATVYEMMCSDAQGNNVIVMAEKLPISLTAEQYVEVLAEQITTVTAVEYEVTGSDEVVTIGGVDFNKLACVADYEGVSLYQDYYVTVKDDRAVALTVTYTDVTGDTMLSAFSAY